MWSVVMVCIVLRIPTGLGQIAKDSTQLEDRYVSAGNEKMQLNESEELKLESLLDELVNSASSATEYIIEKAGPQATILQPMEDGRRLKHKKTELKFMLKTLLILKVVLGLILPLGIIASKILSWKAVTLSLMAFMLAKIFFVKNLLMGKNVFPVTPANFVPPVYIHGGANDAFWKRQGEPQSFYTWSTS